MSEISVRVLSKDFSAAGKETVGAWAEWSSLTATGAAAGYIEWKVNLPTAGSWRLHANMTAAESRPCALLINGVKQSGAILGEVTGSWHADKLTWCAYGPYPFKQGENLVRIEFTSYQPHLKELGFSLVEAAAPAEPQKPAAQSISGTVNTSGAITAIAGNAVTLGGATNPLKMGDRVVVIQMKGAAIDTSDSEAFGTIVSDNGAGRYVWATVLGTSGQEVKLSEDLAGFDAKDGKVQLVRAYSHAGDVNVAGRVDAPAWDGTSGGVIAIESAGTIAIGADIDASGKGFHGGGPSADKNAGTQVGYTSSAGSGNGGKGEGIASFDPVHACGRGAPANGGGGGNSHDSGGGGGGNGGAGGRGGRDWSGTAESVGGISGRSLDHADRAFLGGGGGGGQQNQGGGSAGASGGGIILLRARTITGPASAFVRANGADATNAGPDGAGGGGAGGTIILDASSVSGELTLEARGGRGGGTAWGQGEGGGGGGGVIRASAPLSATVKTAVLGGAPGREGGHATAGASGITGPLTTKAPTGTSGADCEKVREALEKKLAERDQACAAFEKKVDAKLAEHDAGLSALEKKLAERDQACAAYEQKADALEKKIAEQEGSNIDQERRLLEQDRKIAEQDKSNIDQERKLLDQDKKLAEQDKSNIDQERKLLEQDTKLAEQEKSNLQQEKKLFEQDKKLAEQDKMLADLAAQAAKCGACDDKLGAQAKAIDDLASKLADLARKLEEATAKPPPPPPAPPPPPPPPSAADDLETIEGIGPKIAELLKNAGIRTYKDLAAANVADLKKLLGNRFARNDPSSWPKQAQLTAEGKMAELKKLQASLRAGRG